MRRNKEITWKRVFPLLFNFVVNFVHLQLPPYCVLEIFDWLPNMAYVSHRRKIELIVAVYKSYSNVMAARVAAEPENI